MPTPVLRHAYFALGEQTSTTRTWHRYTGTDTPPCGGQYQQPRNAPVPAAQVPPQDQLCHRPGCF